jgi:hypothetical protein
MPRYRITITSKDREAMLDLVRKYKLQVLDHGIRYSEKDGHSVDAIVDAADLAQLDSKLAKATYHVERHEDIDELGKARQQEVGRGNRYKKSNPN